MTPTGALRLADLRTFELLVAISTEGSIGAAARRLGITQQSASQRVREFEATVGVALLARSARGSTLTAEGRAITEWSSRLVDAAHEIEGAILALKAEHAEALRVAASMTVAEHLLPAWLVDLRRGSGQGSDGGTRVSLRAVNSEQVVRLVESGEAELGFVEGLDAPRGLHHADLRTDRLVLVASPDDPLARRGSVSTSVLAGLALTSREPGSGTRAVLESALRAAGHSPAAPAVELATTAAIRETVRAGGSPAVLSALAVEADLRSGALAAVGVRGLDLTRVLRAVWAGGPRPAGGPARALLAIARRAQPADRVTANM